MENNNNYYYKHHTIITRGQSITLDLTANTHTHTDDNNYKKIMFRSIWAEKKGKKGLKKSSKKKMFLFCFISLIMRFVVLFK